MGAQAQPKPTLSVRDVVVLIVGVVVGAGIFKTPSLVAASVSGEATALLAWVLGGVISLMGALVYAELATTYPHAGGDYHYLSRSFGPSVGFLFVWARLAVIQTGAIAMLGFLVGDYVAALLPAGRYGASLYGAAAVFALTALNLTGLRQGRRAQHLLSGAIVLGLLLVMAAGLTVTGAREGASIEAAAHAPAPGGSAAFGAAMIFVLLTYGGWNEAVYLSAELRGGPRALLRALLAALAIITALYLATNVVLLHALGLEGVARSSAVMADLMDRALGRGGAGLISGLVILAALSTMNATIITGARSAYALGRDFSRFALLGRWSGSTSTPTPALLVQAFVALLLVLLGTLTRRGFATMVEYTAPVFWLFFLLVGIALFVLRRKEPQAQRVFRVPLYPLVPLLFCASAGYMLIASLSYTGLGATAGILVLLAGAPLLLLGRKRGNKGAPS
jgi:basic amino acid/polyamine antiporter, APA family